MSTLAPPKPRRQHRLWSVAANQFVWIDCKYGDSCEAFDHRDAPPDAIPSYHSGGFAGGPPCPRCEGLAAAAQAVVVNLLYQPSLFMPVAFLAGYTYGGGLREIDNRLPRRL